MTQERISDEKKQVRKPDATKALAKRHVGGSEAAVSGLISLQQRVGNRAVQRLLASRTGTGLVQRSGDDSFELDDATADRINRTRGGGQSLDGTIQEQMGDSMGHDFSGVRVHTSSESDDLNRQLSARAFTTGQDIFFREGDYNPGSSSGQELIAHELTHVAQQSAGLVGGGSRMTVNAPGDVYEQEADAVAQQALNPSSEAGTEAVHRQIEEEEEPVQAKAIQRQLEEEEPVQAKAIQRQLEEEEEPVQAKAIQRQEIPEEETLVQGKAIQRQEEIPEEEV